MVSRVGGGALTPAEFALTAGWGSGGNGKPVMPGVERVELNSGSAVLARSQANSTHGTPLGDYLPVVLIKLFLHPVLLLLLGLTAIRLGLPLDHFALTVVVLVAALPSASNVALLAERFNADDGRIARIILLSTVLAFFTFSGAVALLV